MPKDPLGLIDFWHVSHSVKERCTRDQGEGCGILSCPQRTRITNLYFLFVPMKRSTLSAVLLACLILVGCDATDSNEAAENPVPQTLKVVDEAGALSAYVEFPADIQVPKEMLNEDGQYELVISKREESDALVAAKGNDSSIYADYCRTFEDIGTVFCAELDMASESGTADATGHFYAASVVDGDVSVFYDGPAGCLNTYPGQFVIATSVIGADVFASSWRYFLPDGTILAVFGFGFSGGCDANVDAFQQIGEFFIDAVPDVLTPMDPGGTLSLNR